MCSQRGGHIQWSHEELEPNFPSASSSQAGLRHVGYAVLLRFGGIWCWKTKFTQTPMEWTADFVKTDGKFWALWKLSG